MDDRGNVVRYPAGQIRCAVHSAYYLFAGSRAALFLDGMVAGPWSWSVISF